MFSSGPTRAEHDALAELVMQQKRVIDLLTEQSEAIVGHLDVVGDQGQQASADLLVIKGMIGGILAEIAARRDDPYGELASILGRMHFTADEFALDDPEMRRHAEAARDFIGSYAEDYLRRGER